VPRSEKFVLSYHKAIQAGDYSGAPKLLHDDLEFQDPIDTSHKEDDYSHAL
jgi:hypothetical protein